MSLEEFEKKFGVVFVGKEMRNHSAEVLRRRQEDGETVDEFSILSDEDMSSFDPDPEDVETQLNEDDPVYKDKYARLEAEMAETPIPKNWDSRDRGKSQIQSNNFHWYHKLPSIFLNTTTFFCTCTHVVVVLRKRGCFE